MTGGRIPSPAWTDESEGDPGITLVGLLAFLGDALSWYQDRAASEARLRTRRRYLLALAALTGFACWRAFARRDRFNDGTAPEGG